MPVSKKEVSECPIDAMLSVVDGRWKGTILWLLSEGSLRTSELRRGIPQITERMLIRHLQDLTRDGVICRTEENGPRRVVRYSISNYGQSLLPVLEVICGWGRTHLEQKKKAKTNRTL